MTAIPELPEVEAIRRVLEPQVRGLVIQEVVLRRPEIVEHPAADEFCGWLRPSRSGWRSFSKKNEMTAEEYLETKGREYRYTPFLQVYGKQGEPCPVCGQALCRTTIGGRSSTFCPHCQT